MDGILNTLNGHGRIPMNRLLIAVATAGVIFVDSQTLAFDSVNQSTMSKRQMISQIVGCMKRRMSANKDSSYKEAMKACKAQINNEANNAPSGASVAPDPEAKP
jgi:hypothetical protein